MPEQITYPVIDHVPSAEELSKSSGVFVDPRMAEYVSPHLLGDSFGERTEADEVDAKLVKNLGQELQFGGPENRPTLVKDAYGVARHFADMAINRRSQTAFDVIDMNRRTVRRATQYVDGSVSLSGNANDASGGHVTHLGGGRLEMGVNLAMTLPGGAEYESVSGAIARAGFNVAPVDISTLMLVQVAGHEAGHIAQRAVAQDLHYMLGSNPEDEVSLRDTVGAHLLTTGAVEPTTGNLQTDAAIYDEQFAEGYGFLAMREAARALGYGEEVATALMDAMSFQEQNLTHGHMLSEVSAEKGLSEVLQEKGIKGNIGELGYTKPRTPDQIISDLVAVRDASNHRIALTQQAYNNTVLQTRKDRAGKSSPSPVNEAKRPERPGDTGRLRRAVSRLAIRANRI